jgi:hypothetical protein
MGATEIGVTCPNCGISVQPEDVICFRCGVSLSLQSVPGSRERADVGFPGLPIIGRDDALPLPTTPLSRLPADQHKVPDTELDAADFDGLAVRGASIRGDEHRQHGVTRKDAMGIYQVRHGTAEAVVACVAGGGTGEFSHIGAAQACRLVRDEATHRLAELLSACSSRDNRAVDKLCADLLASVADRLTALAGALRVTPAALSTRLMAAVVDTTAGPLPRSCVLLAAGQAAPFDLIEYQPGAIVTVWRALHSDLATTEARPEKGALPIPTRTWSMSWKLRPGEPLTICTDGIEAAFASKSLGDAAQAWWGNGRVPSLPEFARQLSARVPGLTGDRTAICLWAS